MRVGGEGGSKGGDVCIHRADSLCSTAEANTPLQSNYTPIKKIMKNKCKNEKSICQTQSFEVSPVCGSSNIRLLREFSPLTVTELVSGTQSKLQLKISKILGCINRSMVLRLKEVKTPFCVGSPCLVLGTAL